MSEIEQYPVLEHIVNILNKAIVDSKVEKKSQNVSVIKDGNSIIQIEQQFDESGKLPKIFITDVNEILFSEDLLVKLSKIHTSATTSISLERALQNVYILVNELSLEAGFILQDVKEALDTVSQSYEFIKLTDKQPEGFTAAFKFGNHKFEIVLVNEPAIIKIDGNLESVADKKVVKTITEDLEKINNILNDIYKKKK